MIRIEGLSFQYENSSRQVLKNLNLTIEDGGFLGIIGPSGAGKSTLTHAINGIIPHHLKGDYYGKVTVEGMDTFEAGLTDLAAMVGTVFQDIDSQMVAAIVEDELLYGLENFGVPRDQIEGRMEEALELVGISHLRTRTISTLSGGQKQKVAIASIVAMRPKVLLLDEPTGELDPASSRQIFALLKQLNETYGMTVIVVEQKIMLLCEFARELGVLSEGEMVFHGPVREVLAHSGELERIGVQCPRVVSLSNEMERRGLGDGSVCIDIREAETMVRRAYS